MTGVRWLYLDPAYRHNVLAVADASQYAAICYTSSYVRFGTAMEGRFSA
jgi:hypothetical protein